MKWKRLCLVMFIFPMLFLVGCGFEITIQEKGSENDSVQEETDNNTSNENEQVENEGEENEGTGNEAENDTDEEAESGTDSDESAKGDMDPATVHRIMETYASMFISSMKLDAYVEATQTNFYQESPLTWDMEIYINQSSKITTYEQILMTDGRTEDVYVEVYSHPDVMFRNIANTGEWLEDENIIGGYRHYYWIDSWVMNHFVQHSDLFVGYDDGSHFRIEFAGTDEQFKEIIFFGFESIADDSLSAYLASEGGDISGQLVMRFEKESYTLTDYTFDYEATTTIPDEGDYHVIETGKYSFSEFEEHNSLTIPSHVYE